MTSSAPVLLIIEDEPQMMRFLLASLDTQGYRLIESTNGADGLAQAAAHKPDAVLLELGLPDMEGLEVVRRLREWTSTPIIVLSVRNQEQDKIPVLDAGADDYMTKPFSEGEMFARLRVVLRDPRRPVEGDQPVFGVGDLQIDLTNRVVLRGGTEVHLTPTEYKLVSTLARHPGRLVTHRQLLAAVWGPSKEGHVNYLRVFVTHLRSKLEHDPTHPRYLVSEPGLGYRLNPDPQLGPVD